MDGGQIDLKPFSAGGVFQLFLRNAGILQEIPENIKTAVLLIAEAYAHNAVEQTKVRLKSETFDDYSYTAESSIIDVGKLGVESLLDDYVVVQPPNGVTMRLRSL